MYVNIIFTACKRSLGQGNVFTPMYHSIYRGGLHPGWGLHLGWGALHPGGGWVDPPIGYYGDAVNERAARIILECILVKQEFFHYQ